MRTMTRSGKHRTTRRVTDALGSALKSRRMAVVTAVVTFVVLFFLEVQGERLGERIGGLPFAYAAFTVVGGLLGLIWLAWISADWQLNDPIFAPSLAIYRRYGFWLLMLYGTIVVGCIGVSAVAKKENHPHKIYLTLAPAIPFAAVWVTVFHLHLIPGIT